MNSFGKVSKWRKIYGWLFFVSGILNLLGVAFAANGAGIGVGIFNTVVGALLLSPGIKA